jgi:hypothetical protein
VIQKAVSATAQYSMKIIRHRTVYFELVLESFFKSGFPGQESQVMVRNRVVALLLSTF